MRAIILFILAGLFLSACAREAYYADHEYGMANNDAFDRQIVYKDYPFADKDTEGMAGIHAEPIMDTYQQTFSESFSQEAFSIYQTGSGSSSGGGTSSGTVNY